MAAFLQVRRTAALAVLCAFASSVLWCQQPIVKKLPADVRALRAARNMPDPDLRLQALRAFLKDYPDSSSAPRAQGAILDVLLKHFPDRVDEIDALAHTLVKAEHKGYDRWNKQMYLADELAAAGVDLKVAESWILDTDRQMTEPHFNEAEWKAYRKYKADPPTREELHKHYVHIRSEVLLVRAHVELKEGHLPEAAALLDQSAPLEPLSDELHYLRGEIALQQHRSKDALQWFEQAQLLGELPEPMRGQMLALYRDEHQGSDAGLQEELDRQYASLYPAAFQPPAHTSASRSHTALLELFTGSGCGPCVAADLAVEALLQAYPRNEVVALAFDQHIPEPDPLANPASIARAEVFGVRSTPNMVLDGKPLPIYGGRRGDTAELYAKLSRAVDTQQSRRSAVALKLASDLATDGALHAIATVEVSAEDALRKTTAQETAPEETSQKDDEESAGSGKNAGGPSPEKTGAAAKPEAPPLPQLCLHFALVEDNVRYSGENGIRFHRMVVRSEQVADSLTLTPGAIGYAEARFDTASIAKTNAAYLESYAQANERFGPIQFLQHDAGMHPGHLALAAWVEDASTHRVLQAAWLPLAEHAKAGETAP